MTLLGVETYTPAVVSLMTGKTSRPWQVILLIGAIWLPGCSVVPNWLRADRWFGSPHDPPTGASADDMDRPSPQAVVPRGPALRVVQLAFDVVRVDFSLEGSRHSQKIWNHVDELRLDATITPHLARNGIRVGAASPDAWAPIQAILDMADAQIRRNQFIPQPGTPLAIQLSTITESELFFTFSPDGDLVGKTFEAGDKLMAIDYAYHPELGGCSDLMVSLEVHDDRGNMTWANQGGVILEVPTPNRHLFNNLRFTMTLNPSELLILGLSDRAKNEYLVGSRFLSFHQAGQRFETLLIVTPRPYSDGERDSETG